MTSLIVSRTQGRHDLVNISGMVLKRALWWRPDAHEKNPHGAFGTISVSFELQRAVDHDVLHSHPSTPKKPTTPPDRYQRTGGSLCEATNLGRSNKRIQHRSGRSRRTRQRGGTHGMASVWCCWRIGFFRNFFSNNIWVSLTAGGRFFRGLGVNRLAGRVVKDHDLMYTSLKLTRPL